LNAVDQEELRIWQAVGWVQNLAVIGTAYCVVCAALEFTAFLFEPTDRPQYGLTGQQYGLTGHSTALQASSTALQATVLTSLNIKVMQLKSLESVSENSRHNSHVALSRLGSVKSLW